MYPPWRGLDGHVGMIFLLLCPDEENGVFAKPLVVQKLALLSIGIKLTMIFGKRWGGYGAEHPLSMECRR